MLLSEAILLGSVGSEQGFGNEGIFKESSAKCALGAALHAVGACPSVVEASLNETHDSNPYKRVKNLWPWVMDIVEHPEGGKCSTLAAIYMLNDTSRWTRPRIAEWVASIEPKEDTNVGGHIEEEVQSGQV